jgi:hypothetical protein
MVVTRVGDVLIGTSAERTAFSTTNLLTYTKFYETDTRATYVFDTGVWNNLGGGGAGEANTALNVGAGGIGVYKQKVGVELQFKKINAGNNRITIADDTTNSEVDIALSEGNVLLQNLGGTLPYAKTNLGNSIVNADINTSAAITWSKVNKSGSVLSDIGDVDISARANGDVPTWNTGTSKWVSQAPTGGGGSGEVNTASNVGTAGVGVFKQKNVYDLQFKKLNAASSRLTVTDNTGASQVDVDLATTLTGMTLTTPTLTTPTINGLKRANAAKTSNYTLLTTDTTIRADASAGAFTLTLPAASGNAGLTYTIIRTDTSVSSNLLTVDGNASETIGGNLTYILYPTESLIIECDGSNWQIISEPAPNPYYYRRAGGTANRRYLAGIGAVASPMAASTTGPVVNTLYALPFVVPRRQQFDLIECEVTTLGTGSNIRLGIYRDSGNCYPGGLLFDSGNLSAASTGIKSATITAAVQTFQPGLYWLTYENSATVPLIRMLNVGAANPWQATLGFSSMSDTTSDTQGLGWTVAHTVGALPDPYTAGGTIRTTSSAATAPLPAIGLRPI